MTDSTDARRPLAITILPSTLHSSSPDDNLNTYLTTSPTSNRQKPTHRTKKGDTDHIKRPQNAFILFRRQCASTSPTKKARQADLSKTISQKWRALSTTERAYWDALAKEKKQEHEAMYPEYVFRPRRRGRSIPRRAAVEEEALDFDILSSSRQAESTPAYQRLQIPIVDHSRLHPSEPSVDNQFDCITSQLPSRSLFEPFQFDDVFYPPFGSSESSSFKPPTDSFAGEISCQSTYAGSIWPDDNGLFLSDDFDLNAIPPLDFQYDIGEFFDDSLSSMYAVAPFELKSGFDWTFSAGL